MIYSITGKVSRLDDNKIIVDTGNLAYEVVCSTYAVFELSGKSEPQTILTYLQVREDAMCLYGFLNKKEKLLFNNLLLVSGVGPKMAITVLSGLPCDDIIKAIINSDTKTLSTIKGLGKKTTERIVLELNNKLGGENSLENLLEGENSKKDISSKEIDDAVQVLVSTGVSKSNASIIAKDCYCEGMTSEELILKCFKNLK